MKKIMSTLIATCMIASLTGCGSSRPAATTAAPAETRTTAATTAEAETTASEVNDPSAAPEFVIKLANPSNPEDNVVKAFYEFEKLVEERSDGRIDVQVYDSGQLGSHSDCVDSMMMHSLQAAECNTSVLGNLDPAFSIFDLPYLTDGMESEIRVVNGELGDVLNQRLEDKAGLHIVGWFVRSPRSIYTNKGPVSSLDDLKGTKIRIMESAIMSKAMELLDMIPVPLAATERYMALQTGTVDAAENSVPLIITQVEYEVTKYVVLSEHFCTPNVMLMDLEFYNSLPDDLKVIVDEAGAEAGRYSSQLDQESLETALEQLSGEYGMTICEIPDKTEFMEAVTPLYDEYRDTIGQEIYDYFGK